jgi:hypothetical protein
MLLVEAPARKTLSAADPAGVLFWAFTTCGPNAKSIEQSTVPVVKTFLLILMDLLLRYQMDYL